AKWYLMTGDWINATEAERCGLITEVVDDGEALNRAHEIAERFLHGPQLAIRYTKRALNQWMRLGFMTSFDLSLHLEALTMLSDDAKVAVQKLRSTNKGVMPPPRRREPVLAADSETQA
ncbi:MAG: enoyl-CoA hydratase-related protein, partial [Acidimicrobiales bacterium]